MLRNKATLRRLLAMTGVAGIALLAVGSTPANASEIASGRAFAAVVPAPQAVSPVDGTMFTHYPRTTTLTWSSVSGTSYKVEVQCLHCQTSGQWSTWTTATTNATTYGFTWVGDNDGRWRVTSVASGQTSGWTRFSYRTGGGGMPAPAQLAPADGSVFGHYPRVTTLVWGPVEGAASYRIESQYCDPAGCAAGASSYSTRDLAGTSYTFDFVGAQPGRWRVTAFDAAGTAGVTSAWSNFRYTV